MTAFGRKLLSGLNGGLAALMLAGLAFAHHSVRVNFDQDNPIQVTGVVTEIHIRNPHSQYVMEVAEADGSSTEWLVDWADKNALTRRGLNLDLIKVGDTVKFTLFPSVRLDHVGFFVQAELEDGTIFKDCGFREFREAVAAGSPYACPEAQGARQ